MDEIRILQLGAEDWSKTFSLPDYIIITYTEHFEEAPKKPYDLVFIDRDLQEEELEPLHEATKAHALFVLEGQKLTPGMEDYFACKKGQTIARTELLSFLQQEARNFFAKPYGEKFRPYNMNIAQGFAGKVIWDGNYSVTVEGEFGEDFQQIAYWRNNIPVMAGQAIDLWLEYRKDPGVEIALSITQFYQGAISDVQQSWHFTEEELQNVVVMDNQKDTGPIFVSLQAKGKGSLKIIALHDRYSRRGRGHFLPGGKRYVTSEREELFTYFDPGDRKPPLNVYFAGYKTLQGFEGYNMMRNMGGPFLLVAEPRLEGGSFYMGSHEYESMLKSALREPMEELGFTRDHVVFSGLSMGTYGALYYGCDIQPHAIILGKPLASIGDVAANERIQRPGGFPTSLDVLHKLCGDMDDIAIQTLNHRFWDKFDGADWSRTKFVVSYMIEDDYDSTAYDTMLSHLQSGGVQVYGKGIHGRHNDDTYSIVNWFVSQFNRVLQEDFGREIKKK